MELWLRPCVPEFPSVITAESFRLAVAGAGLGPITALSGGDSGAQDPFHPCARGGEAAFADHHHARWPGTFLELLHLIPLLTNPQEFGGEPNDSFGRNRAFAARLWFSGRPSTPGWNTFKTRRGLGRTHAATRVREVRSSRRRLWRQRFHRAGMEVSRARDSRSI